MYTADIVSIVERQGLAAHQYNDDIQIYGCCCPNDSTPLCCDFGGCIKQLDGYEPSSAECRKDGIHVVRSTMSSS